MSVKQDIAVSHRGSAALKDKVETFGRKYFEVISSIIGYNYRERALDLQPLADVCCTLIKPSRSLDIGCAKGYMVMMMRKTGVEAYGVDISLWAIKNAPSAVRRYLYFTDLETRLSPFRDHVFDCITMIDTIEHFSPDRLRFVLDEICRVLKPSGMLIVRTPDPRKPFRDKTEQQIINSSSWRVKIQRSAPLLVYNRKVTKALSKQNTISYVRYCVKYTRGKYAVWRIPLIGSFVRFVMKTLHSLFSYYFFKTVPDLNIMMVFTKSS